MFDPTDLQPPADPPITTDISPPADLDLTIGRLVAAFGGGELVATRSGATRPLTAA